MPRAIITTLEGAVGYLKKKTEWDQFPKLSDSEGGDLEDILGDNVLGSVWDAGSAVALGDIIVPTEGNRTGRQFRCVNPGVTSETEPSWSDGAFWVSAINSGVLLGNVGSGRIVLWDGSAAWVDAGLEQDLWDLDEAVGDAWRKKAQRVANLTTSNQAGNTHNLAELRRNFLDEASRWGGRFIV